MEGLIMKLEFDVPDGMGSVSELLQPQSSWNSLEVKEDHEAPSLSTQPASTSSSNPQNSSAEMPALAKSGASAKKGGSTLRKLRNKSLWEYFEEVPFSNAPRMSSCTIMQPWGKECGHKCARHGGSTTIMRRHLEKSHPRQFAAYVKEQSCVKKRKKNPPPKTRARKSPEKLQDSPKMSGSKNKCSIDEQPGRPSTPPAGNSGPVAQKGGPPKGRMKNKVLWEFFEEVTTAKKPTCRCTILNQEGKECGQTCVRPDGSTTIMKRHLQRLHPKEFAEYMKEQPYPKRRSKNPPPVMKARKSEEKQSDLLQSKRKCSINSREQRQFDFEVMTMLGRTSTSFALVDHPGWIEFMEDQKPYLNARSSDFFRRRFHKVYNVAKRAVDEILANDLPSCSLVAFTSDHWSSGKNELFQSLTIHFVNKEFHLKRFLVTVQKAQMTNISDDAINSRIQDMIQDLKLPASSKVVMVTYVPSNMGKAMLTGESVSTHLVCLAHVMNACINKALEDQETLKVLTAKVMKLAGKAHESKKNRDDIAWACQSQDIQPRKILQPCDGRWDSLEACLKSVVDIEESLLHLAQNRPESEVSEFVPSRSDFALIKQLLVPLSRLRQLSEELSSEERPTIHLVTPSLMTMTNLQEVFAKNVAVLPQIKEFCRIMASEVEQRIPDWGMNIILYNLGNFLNPAYKGNLLRLGGPEVYTDTVAYITDIFNTKTSDRGQSVDSEPSESKWDWLYQVSKNIAKSQNMEIDSSQDNVSSRLPIEEELKRYDNLPVSKNLDLDILDFWRQQATELPNLASLAREVLAIPGTSASSERGFSATGNSVSGERAGIEPGRVEMLAFVHDNYNRVKEKLKVLMAEQILQDCHRRPRSEDKSPSNSHHVVSMPGYDHSESDCSE